MEGRKVVILGAGITGLSFAYYLKKFHPSVDFKIYESANKAGGVVFSEKQSGCILEWGPRGVRPKGKGREVLELVDDLGLWNRLVFADDKAKKRYLYHDGSLNVLPYSLKSLLTSPYLGLFFKAIVRDLRSTNYEGDETIASFVDRHFGEEFRSLFFDSIVSGIWAGDVGKMSISATLPFLKRLEQKRGSILKGLVKDKSKSSSYKKYPKDITSKALFSFKNGVQELVDALVDELSDYIAYNAEVTNVDVSGEVKVMIGGDVVEVSDIVSTIPAYKLSGYLKGDLSSLLASISYSPVALHNVIIDKSELSFDGFGFLVPSREKSIVLGMVANTNTFPEHSLTGVSVNTVMMGGARFSIDELRSRDLYLESTNFLNKVFREKVKISSSELKLVERAIPQYELGHLEKVKRIEELSGSNLTILGNYMYGVSLIDIISKSKEVARDFV
jgi:oxygen-dependent protoporphyrinogen oxidase